MQKTKVVLVDDDRELTTLLDNVLSKANYDVHTAANGEDGLQLVKKTKPDYVFLDIMMPNMDGYQVLKALKNDLATRDIPVTLLTALGLEEDIKKGISLGATNYLVKPVKVKVLMQYIETALQ